MVMHPCAIANRLRQCCHTASVARDILTSALAAVSPARCRYALAPLAARMRDNDWHGGKNASHRASWRETIAMCSPDQAAVGFWLDPIPPEDMPMLAARMLAEGHHTRRCAGPSASPAMTNRAIFATSSAPRWPSSAPGSATAAPPNWRPPCLWPASCCAASCPSPSAVCPLAPNASGNFCFEVTLGYFELAGEGLDGSRTGMRWRMVIFSEFEVLAFEEATMLRIA
jgi:hypothetical protein